MPSVLSSSPAIIASPSDSAPASDPATSQQAPSNDGSTASAPAATSSGNTTAGTGASSTPAPPSGSNTDITANDQTTSGPNTGVPAAPSGDSSTTDGSTTDAGTGDPGSTDPAGTDPAADTSAVATDDTSAVVVDSNLVSGNLGGDQSGNGGDSNGNNSGSGPDVAPVRPALTQLPAAVDWDGFRQHGGRDSAIASGVEPGQSNLANGFVLYGAAGEAPPQRFWLPAVNALDHDFPADRVGPTNRVNAGQWAVGHRADGTLAADDWPLSTPELAGVLGEPASLDTSVLDRALQQFLNACGTAADQLQTFLGDFGGQLWVGSTLALALALELVRRQTQRDPRAWRALGNGLWDHLAESQS